MEVFELLVGCLHVYVLKSNLCKYLITLLRIEGLPKSNLFNINEGNISQTSATTASVVLRWKVEGDNISRVVVSSIPALPCGNVDATECEVGEGEREWNQTVQFGVNYNFIVRAINSCGNETESDTLQLLLNGRHMQ